MLCMFNGLGTVHPQAACNLHSGNTVPTPEQPASRYQTADTVSGEARTRNEHLVQQPVRLVEVEHQVELTHVAEVPVQHLHKVVNHIKCQELVVGGVDGAQKVEAGVALVDQLEVAPVEEVAVLRSGGSCSGGQQQRCNKLACAYIRCVQGMKQRLKHVAAYMCGRTHATAGARRIAPHHGVDAAASRRAATCTQQARC